MRRVSVGRVLAVAALALLMAGPAFAQGREIVVAGGWAPTYISVEGGSTTAPLGFMFNVAASVVPKVQIVGDLGYARKSELDATVSFTTATGGVRYAVPMGPQSQISPFVEALLGIGSVSAGFEGISGSETAFTYGVGGGLDIKATGKLNVRFQANYFRAQKYGVGINLFRFGIGISTAAKI